MSVGRRNFLVIFLAFAAYLFSGAARRLHSYSKPAAAGNTDMKAKSGKAKNRMQQRVAVAPCETYRIDEVRGAVEQALESIGFAFKARTSVLIKPNIMAQNAPEQCATTHPALVEALCAILRDSRCAVTIGDSSAFYQGGGTRAGFGTTGISAVAKKYGARLLPFEATTLRKIETGRSLNPFYVTGAVFEHDLVVNAPKLKLHRLARYTGGIKNMYGCVPGGAKQVYHRLFQHRADYQEFWAGPLVDVFEAVEPGLTVMDAVVGLDKDGPAATGEPRQTGVIIASTNAAALDCVACGMIGFDPYGVPAVREAIRRGLADPGKIGVIGDLPRVPYDRLPDVEIKTGLAKTMDDFMFDQFIVEPRIDLSACDRCGACVEKCAPHAVGYDGSGRPVIDYGECIYCYCCEEYCDKKAVSLHGGVINHAIRAVRRIMRI